MHRLAKTTWERVLDRLCQITTTGIDGYKYDPSEIKFKEIPNGEYFKYQLIPINTRN